MRTPTTASTALRWHTQAMSDKALHLEIQAEFETPHVGWFMTRVVRGGPWVPARIFIEQEVCEETSELLSDEVMRCEIAGRLRDPYESWHYLFQEPIEEAAYLYLMARAEYAQAWAPQEPAAKPFQRVDWGTVPTPTFSTEKEISP
jgi:hypothetical protein